MPGKTEIKVLGPGCPRCHELDRITREVVKELSIDANIEHVQDINKIIEYPILTTPGLVVNGKVVCSGKVPSKSEIAGFITNAR
jgi:small redox-active disulfide protein 2